MKATVIGLVFTFMFAARAALAQSSVMPPDSEIRNILVERIDKEHQSVGIVVGVIDTSGRRIVSYGSVATGDKRTLDGNTISKSDRSPKCSRRCCCLIWCSAAKLR
jgi:hypothetical protein